MPDLAKARDMAVDRNIVGRIGEHHLGRLSAHEGSDHRRIQSIPADQVVLAQQPDISYLGDCGSFT